MKKITQNISLLLLILSATFISSCSKDDSSDGGKNFNGSEKSIKSFVGEEIYDQLVAFGFNINAGDTPPSIEGSFFADNVVVLDSSVPSDFPGKVIASQSFTFSNQDNESLSVDYIASGGSQSDEGSGSYISGSSNNFLVLLKNYATIQGYTSEGIYAISGTMSEEGILEYQLAVFTVDTGDAPEGIFIPEGQGRVVHDTDDLAERTN